MNLQYLNNIELTNLKKLSSILGRDLLFVDLEATALVHQHNFSIIEIGIIIVTPQHVIEKSSLVDPLMPIPYHITNLTGINNEMVKGKKTFSHFNSYFEKISKTHILCGYNSKAFDSTGICKMGKQHGRNYSFLNQLDIRYLFLRNRNELMGIKSQKGSLTEASDFYKVNLTTGNAHRAAYDIALTALLAESIISFHGFETLLPDIEKLNCLTSKNNFKNYLTFSK